MDDKRMGMARNPHTGDYGYWREVEGVGRVWMRDPLEASPFYLTGTEDLKHGNGDSYSWARNGEDD